MANGTGVWRPRTTALLVGGAILIIVATAIAFITTTFQPKIAVRLGTNVFQLRLANDESSREIGLSNVDSLRSDEGLLMQFPSESKWGIWMKNMKIPIDIVWLDSGKEVVHIVKNAQPELSTAEVFQPSKPAMYVIELKAGAVEQNAIKVGSVAEFTIKEEAN